MQTIEQITYDHKGNVIERSVSTKERPAASVEISTDGNGNPKPFVKVFHDAQVPRLNCTCEQCRQSQDRSEA